MIVQGVCRFAMTRPDPATCDCVVIIPHYNDVARLLRCLDALMPQVDERVDVVVADNSSPVSLDEVTAKYPTVRIVTEPEKGAGLARNRGVMESTAPVILFIDSDCVPCDDWLAVGRRIARTDTLIGGPVGIFHETPPPKSGAEAFEEIFAFKMKKYLEDDNFLGSGNLVFHRDVFDRAGGFRAGISEDTEWSQRVASHGITLAFDDDFIASHPSRQDWDALRRKWRRIETENYGWRGDSAKTRVKRAVKALGMPVSIFAHAPQIFSAKGLTGGEKRAALGTLARIRLARMGWLLKQAATGRAE